MTFIVYVVPDKPNRLISFLVALAFVLLMAAGCAQAQSPLPSPSGYVNDYAGVIDQPTKQQLETTLSNLDQQQRIQFAVAVIDTTGGQDVFEYSLAVARGWGLGSKDTSKPSLLLLVAIKERKAFTQVSRHLEGDLPDGLVGQIQREQLVPAFKAGEYGKGISNTVETYINTLASKQGFSTDKIFAPGSQRVADRSRGGRSTGSSSIFFLIVIAVFVIIVIARLGRRGRGGPGGGSGGWMGWLLLGSLLNSGTSSGSSGWRGGGFGGGDSGSGGGGFGGFGGGGDFGGGGAGASW